MTVQKNAITKASIDGQFFSQGQCIFRKDWTDVCLLHPELEERMIRRRHGSMFFVAQKFILLSILYTTKVKYQSPVFNIHTSRKVRYVCPSFHQTHNIKEQELRRLSSKNCRLTQPTAIWGEGGWNSTGHS